MQPASSSPSGHASPPVLAGASVEAIAFADLEGWAADDHASAWRVWLTSCRRLLGDPRPRAARTGLPADSHLRQVCADGLDAGALDGSAARRFFETRFQAWQVTPDGGRPFFTGYYEPEVDGSLVREGAFQTPVLGRPPDLVSNPGGESGSSDDGPSAGRRGLCGGLEPYPDRRAIDSGALDRFDLALLYLADPVDRFFLQVQGSGRVRLPDGRVVRLAYDGRNGQPYTPIGRIVADMTGTPRPAMTMPVLRAWLHRDAAAAREIMWQNRSFVFFRKADELDPALGPIGGEGVPVTPDRSLAIDRSVWPYGTPVFVGTTVPAGPDGALQPFRRLMVAQDTGSAIIGPARADIFFGSGPAAGAVAGSMRHEGSFVVLWPEAGPVVNR